MAAINITSGNTDNNDLFLSGRVVVRTSNGIPYVVIENTSDKSIDVWKADSTTPTSFAEQDSANKPDATDYENPSAAIDSGDVIHIVYVHDDDADMSSVQEVRYVTFDTSTDTFSGDETVYAFTANVASSTTGTSISVDSSDIPHIAAIERITNMGTTYDTVGYANRVGGSWNSVVEVEGGTTEKVCFTPKITLTDEDTPEIVYINGTDSSVAVALGNLNNATSFTLHDVDTSVNTNATTNTPSIVVDSSGDTWIAYIDLDLSVDIAQHQDGDGWTTWQTPVTNGNTGRNPTLVANGTDIYVFYEEDTGEDIVYDKYTGSWLGETVLETGTYNNVKAKWAFSVDFDSSGTDRGGAGSRPEIDYVFQDETATTDILWNKLDLLAVPTRTLLGVGL